MALTDKAYVAVHDKTGGDLVKLKDEFDAGYLGKIAGVPSKEPALAALVYQIGLLQDEIDYLRTEISSNKDKKGMTLGTSGTTALAGDTALLALGTSGSTALAGNTKLLGIGNNTTLSFGDMITTTVGKPPKTTTTYSIVMTVTNGGVSKSTTLTLT